jgi:hypothetical protein
MASLDSFGSFCSASSFASSSFMYSLMGVDKFSW